MRVQAHGLTVDYDWEGNATITVTVPHQFKDTLHLENLTGVLDVEIKKHRERRSLNANALFWKCVNEAAKILDASNEEIYLRMLDQYGVQKYIVVRPEAVEAVTKLFRAVDDMGRVLVNGKEGRQLKCTIGSSQYDTEQMSRLIRGITSENKEIGAWVPDEADIGYSLNLWEKERD